MARKAHLRERKQSFASRRQDRRNIRRRFLIVCEGETTEPNYFRGFRIAGVVITVEGAGDNTRRLVERAIEASNGGDYDRVWCVFDRDSFPAKHFNAAFELAKNNGVEIAYSNEAFELWYLLHFNFYDAAMSRASYQARLTQLLGFRYEKNSRSMFDALSSRLPTAIRNAKRLLQNYQTPSPEKDNPSTTVHKLIEDLLADT